MKSHISLIKSSGILTGFWCFLLLFSPSPVSAQPAPTRPLSGATDISATSSRFLFKELWNDFAYLTSEPDFYLVLGGIASAPEIFHTAFKNEEPEITEHWGPSAFADGFFEFGESAGQGAYWLAFSAGSWALGKARNSPKMAEFGSDMFRAHVLNVLFTATLKAAFNRTRPNGAPYSYPSGHTSTAYTTAGALYAHFGKSAGVPAFVMATYVGLSRLQEGKHFASDVLAGGILGAYIGLKIARRGERHGPVSISPYTRESGAGLSFQLRF